MKVTIPVEFNMEKCNLTTNLMFTKLKLILNCKPVYIFPDECKKETICDH